MHTITLNSFIVNIMVTNLFDTSIISDPSFIEQLNTQNYPRGIVEILESLGNLVRIQIFNLNNTLLLSSEYAVE